MNIIRKINIGDNSIQWNEISLCSIDPIKIVFRLSKSDNDLNVAEIVFDDYIYLSVTREGDRFLELIDIMKEVKYLQNFIYEFNPSPIIENMKKMPHRKVDVNFKHYVIVDEDNWYDIISNVDPRAIKI